MATKKTTTNDSVSKEKECFIIMPISDQEGYEKGHFKQVYEDIFKPACQKAGYTPIRADEVTETDMIHVSILQKLIETPMAICDLTTRNPNVLFELGIRQAFDKPVVIVQEEGTPRIFDVSILRAYEYGKELKYRQVNKDQSGITEMLLGTQESSEKEGSVNSIIKLLSLPGPANLTNISDPQDQMSLQLQMIQSQINQMSNDIRNIRRNKNISDIERNNLFDHIIGDHLDEGRYIFDKLIMHISNEDREESIQWYEKFMQFYEHATQKDINSKERFYLKKLRDDAAKSLETLIKNS